MTVLCFESEIERMGRLAHQCEVWACEEGVTVREVGLLLEHAANCRVRQVLLLQGLRRCETDGCLSLVAGSALCARCEDERGVRAYPFAGVLVDPLWMRVLAWLEGRKQ